MSVGETGQGGPRAPALGRVALQPALDLFGEAREAEVYLAAVLGAAPARLREGLAEDLPRGLVHRPVPGVVGGDEDIVGGRVHREVGGEVGPVADGSASALDLEVQDVAGPMRGYVVGAGELSEDGVPYDGLGYLTTIVIGEGLAHERGDGGGYGGVGDGLGHCRPPRSVVLTDTINIPLIGSIGRENMRKVAISGERSFFVSKRLGNKIFYNCHISFSIIIPDPILHL